MVEVIRLAPGEQMSILSEQETWIVVEASDDGQFFGTGYGKKADGEDVLYMSSTESDGSLKAAIAAATMWAEQRGVSRIWVQTMPD